MTSASHRRRWRDVLEPRLAELFARIVLRVGDAVREEDEAIAGRERVFRLLERQVDRQEAERRTGRRQPSNRPVLTHDEIVEVSGAEEGHRAACRIERRERRGHILFWRRRAEEQRTGFGREGRQIARAPEQRPQRRLHVAHDQRRRQSLACDIGHAQKHGFRAVGRAHADDVVIIAAAAPRGTVSRRQLVAIDRRQCRRKEIRLDARGERQLAVEAGTRQLRRLLQRLQPFPVLGSLHGSFEEPRVLDRGCGLQRQGIEQLELRGRVFHALGAAEGNQSDDALADLERRGDERANRRRAAHPPWILRHVVDDLADTARCDRADDAFAGRERFGRSRARRRNPRPP